MSTCPDKYRDYFRIFLINVIAGTKYGFVRWRDEAIFIHCGMSAVAAHYFFMSQRFA